MIYRRRAFPFHWQIFQELDLTAHPLALGLNYFQAQEVFASNFFSIASSHDAVGINIKVILDGSEDVIFNDVWFSSFLLAILKC